MLETTLAIVKSGLRADPTLTPADRTKILAMIRNMRNVPARDSEALPAKSPGIVRRKEAARRLSRSLRAVDQLCRDGALKKVRFPGRQRCTGISTDSLDALIRSLNGEPVAAHWAEGIAKATEAFVARQKVQTR
jgi:hypothetical protein